MALTNKQQVFIDEYLQCWNATRAARVAGYKIPRQSGTENLANPVIKAEINQRIQEKHMQADEVLALLAQQARGAAQDFIEIKGTLPFMNWEKLEAAGGLKLIKKIKYDSEGRPEVEFYDAQSALNLIGKHLGLFVDRQEVTGKDGGPIEHRITGLEDMADDDLKRLIE